MREKIQKQLKDCSAYLILFGQDETSNWKKSELQYALQLNFEHDLPILPVRLPGVTPEVLPESLSKFQSLELTEPFNLHWLARRLTELIKGQKTLDKRHHHPESTKPVAVPWKGSWTGAEEANRINTTP